MQGRGCKQGASGLSASYQTHPGGLLERGSGRKVHSSASTSTHAWPAKGPGKLSYPHTTHEAGKKNSKPRHLVSQLCQLMQKLNNNNKSIITGTRHSEKTAVGHKLFKNKNRSSFQLPNPMNTFRNGKLTLVRHEMCAPQCMNHNQ